MKILKTKNKLQQSTQWQRKTSKNTAHLVDAMAATIAQPHMVKTSGSVVKYCNVTANEKMPIFRIKIITIVQSTSRLADSDCFSICPKRSDFPTPECYGFETRGKSESN